jgi:hypothetical protein
MTPIQCRAARTLCGWSAQDLAVRADISRVSIEHYELQFRLARRCSFVDTLRRVFERTGIRFEGDNGIFFPADWNKQFEMDTKPFRDAFLRKESRRQMARLARR